MAVVLVLCAALLVVSASGAAAAGIDLEPQRTGNRAVKAGDAVVASGTAPAGTVESARLVALDAAGTAVATEEVPPEAIRPPGRGQHVWNDNGTFSAELVLGCVFANPANTGTQACAARGIRAVRLDTTISGAVVSSDLVRVDYTNPFVRGYELIDPRHIRVVFSEPVRRPAGESFNDWDVTNPDRNVIGATGGTENDCVGRYVPGEDAAAGPTGCTRVLEIDLPLAEDDKPFTIYKINNLPDYEGHEDYAGNTTIKTNPGARSNAADVIRPAVPRLRTLGDTAVGAQDQRIVGNMKQLTATVGALTAGHKGFVQVLRDGAVVAESTRVVAPASSVPGTSSVEVTVQLPQDGQYVVSAVAEDVNGNLSTDRAKSSARSDASVSSATYVLDTVAPTIINATRQGSRQVVVSLSEAVTPDGNAGRWTIAGTAPTTVEGRGNVRVLTAGSDLPQDELQISWEPTGTGEGQVYLDQARNPLVPRTLTSTGLPPLPFPSVNSPRGAEVFTKASTFPVVGTVESTLQTLEVELYELESTGNPVARARVVDGQWGLTAPLPADGRYQYEVGIYDTASQTRSTPLGRDWVADIVRDVDPPDVTVTAPQSQSPGGVGPGLQARQRYAVGDPLDIKWTASDAAPGDEDHTRASTVFAVPAGGEASQLDRIDHVAGDLSYRYTVTPQLLGGGSEREATFRVITADAAANEGQDESSAVLIVKNLTGYDPYLTGTGGDTEIEAHFPVLLSGQTVPTDWTVRGQRVRDARMETRDGKTVVVLVPVQQETDPNPQRLEVAYKPTLQTGVALPVVQPLRGPDGPVNEAPRDAGDAVAPHLEIAPPAEGPVDEADDTATLSGRSDVTAKPNDARVFAADAQGRSTGQLVGSVRTAPDGTFTLDVPLARDATNRFVVEASDGRNLSPQKGFRVLEDSTPPAVVITSPPPGSTLARTQQIRWTTTDAHPAEVQLEYRIDAGEWREITGRMQDTGAYDWAVPSEISRATALDIRVTAYDALGKDGAATVSGLLVDFVAPKLLRARSTSERTVLVTFDEPVTPAAGASGFSLPGQPSVASVTADGSTLTLTLSSDLTRTDPDVAYAGKAVVDKAGNAAGQARVKAERGFAFAVTGLAGAGNLEAKRATLSWADERNRREHLARYEVRRDGRVVAAPLPDQRRATDNVGVAGLHTYEVVAVDDKGNVSRPVAVTVDLRDRVPQDPAAPGAAVPNVTPAGGTVLSDDGQAVAIFPPGAVTTDAFGTLEAVATAQQDGVVYTRADRSPYHARTAHYRLTLVSVDGAPIDVLQRFATLSFRPDGGFGSVDSARLAGLRAVETVYDEMPLRAGLGSAETDFLTVGTFVAGESLRPTLRMAGTDPALGRDRFTTATVLSQLRFATAGAAVIARADDYPDALAAATLAASLAGPVLLSSTDALPAATVLELQRLGVTEVVLVGGEVAVGQVVAEQLAALGFTVERVAGDTRFSTAARIADKVGGSRRAYVATGRGFADALSGSAGAAALGRPIFLTEQAELPNVTLRGLLDAGVTDIDLLGGPAAVSVAVEQRLVAEGFAVRRIAGADRYQTSVALARALAAEGFNFEQPLAASGVGDGKTSPDALAAGPIAGGRRSPLVLVPPTGGHLAVDEFLRTAPALRAITVAGGPAAIAPDARYALDATRG